MRRYKTWKFDALFSGKVVLEKKRWYWFLKVSVITDNLFGRVHNHMMIVDFVLDNPLKILEGYGIYEGEGYIGKR